MDFDSYIVFLLGADNFKISRKIRNMANEFGIDELYNCCIYIAQQFKIYDQDNINIMSQYDSFCNFLTDYDKEINEYLDNNVLFKIKGDKE